jgi:AbrB family looped-hinge helix DNA binding protein
MRRLVRVRGRNQITIPARIADHLGLHENDVLDFTLDEAGATVTIKPARLVTAGSPEAARLEQRAGEDLRTGRVRNFPSAEAYARHLLRKHDEGSEEKIALEENRQVAAGVHYKDKVLTCSDCGSDFVLTAGEQAFLADKGFRHEPRQCAQCRRARTSAAAPGKQVRAQAGHAGALKKSVGARTRPLKS